jgi:iron complex outermembrane receptor protein
MNHSMQRNGVPGSQSMCAILLLLAGATGVSHADGLEEIVVTAQKREQSIQDVSISITAVSGDALRQLGLTSTSELGSLTPGLMIWEFGNSPTVSVFTIRGVSQNDFADHNEVPNALYTDGAYVSFVGAIGSQMYDVERVEVLRGPQGTLFGRNATGGLVHLISRRPTQEFEGYTDITYADYDQLKFEGAVSGALTDQLLGRLSVATNRQDGFIENRIGEDSGEDDQINARLQLQWLATESTSVLLNLRTSRIDDINAGGYDLRPGYHDPANDGLIEFVPPGMANPTCPLFFGIDAPPGQTDCFGYTEPDDDPYTASFDRGNLSRTHDGATLTVEGTAGGVDLTWLVDGQQLDKEWTEDTDSTPIPVLQLYMDQDAQQFSSELRADGESGALRWTAGLYYLAIDGDYTVGLDSQLFGAAIRNDFELETRSQAVFGQLEYDLGDRWTLIAGLRQTWDQKDFVFEPSCVGAGCVFFAAPGSAQVLGLVDDSDDSEVSAKLGLDWQASDDLLVYAAVTRGTKGGGFSAPLIASQAPEQLPYDGEVLTDYELGFKWTLPDGRTRLNAGFFYYDYEGYQDYDVIALTQFITNKDAEVAGGELELMTSLESGLDAALGVSVLDATVLDVTLPSGRVADRDMPQAPSLSVNGLLRKEWTFDAGYFAVQGDFKYVDSRYFKSINHPALHEGSSTVGNVRMSFEAPDRRWGLAVFCRNVTDEEYRVMAFEVLNVNGVVNSNYGQPRTFGATASLRW